MFQSNVIDRAVDEEVYDFSSRSHGATPRPLPQAKPAPLRLIVSTEKTSDAVIAVAAPSPQDQMSGEDAIKEAAGASSRALDVSVALAATLFFGPLMLLIALGIRLTGKGPVFFKQPRVGKDGSQFNCFKFRTMRTDAEEVLAATLLDPAARIEWDRDHKLRNDPRITWIGRFLRKTSLDELPQIMNVLCGHMSIVGPRPIVAAEVSRYGNYIGAYYSVRPGITGLWQVSGRNHTSYRRRVACDVTYARSRSAKGDLAIMARTIPAVLLARGAY